MSASALYGHYVESARRMALSPPSALRHGAPRWAAVLLRHGLEHGLRLYLSRKAPGSQATNFTVQLICLRKLFADKALAKRAASAWSALSAASHHNGYELPPSMNQLSGWMDTVDLFLATVDGELLR